MAKENKGLKKGQRRDGVRTVRCHSWKAFQRFILDDVRYSDYVYRGQACSNWKLETSLDRALNDHHRGKSKADKKAVIEEHLSLFRAASRGRRGMHPYNLDSDKNADDEWWALGQHHGLYSPLLDWTTSPYVAAFFAFLPEREPDFTQFRAIWSLYKPAIEAWGENLASKQAPRAKFVTPLSNENDRLLAQGGLFTRTAVGIDMESWVRMAFKGSNKVILDKILIPGSYRSTVLICGGLNSR